MTRKQTQRTSRYPTGKQEVFNARWEPRKRAMAHLRKTVSYFATSGRGRDHPREWHTADGRTLNHWQARDEIQLDCQANGYVYTFVASSRWAEVTPEDVRAAMDAGGHQHYYFVMHENTDNPHAHIISFVKSSNEIGRHLPLDEMKDRWTDRVLEREREQTRELARDAERSTDHGLDIDPG